MNKQICVYFKMCIYLVSGERTLGIKFLIIKSAFKSTFFDLHYQFLKTVLKVEKVDNHHSLENFSKWQN